MAKRRLTAESCTDSRDRKRVQIFPAGTFHEFNEFGFSGDGDDEYEQEHCESSVGSNHPTHEVIILSDNDNDEVESPPPKINSSSQEDITGDESQETKTGITLLQSQTAVKNQCGEIELTDEELNWWAEYGSMIVDDNGFLLGEYRRLDEQLYISIAAADE
ncbi:hypothetical protein L2E82_13850 [Cichorium intybus]|uniref:Uncharacterized protein n=1 Tax=Cichorium intybus TaxID=13427 RepID=A0ACB9EYD6_CICIN|nr:hypothetical protein L1887_33494 [Cichorium endivia]KAI3763852.1 hypothetical protein L2E82_13850 [Cichorium intybus]